MSVENLYWLVVGICVGLAGMRTFTLVRNKGRQERERNLIDKQLTFLHRSHTTSRFECLFCESDAGS